ncbi:MAG: S1 RNA-binding domain-containing protein, partial [Spirochaetales bacterium]|nr:S1 RNA-binding domain-containing protein [Spirochaetales bacterium]
KAKIVKITNVGAFIELSEGIDGFLHVDDLSWTRRVKNPGSILKTGEEIEVAIIEIDKKAHRIRLGVKQLSDDPWDYLRKNFPKNSYIDGEITNITDFGVFVKVIGGIEGLVSKYNLVEPGADDSRDEDYLSRFKTGQKVKALITEINSKTQRLSLSIKDYEKGIQRKELSKYIHDEDGESTATFGDFLKGLDQDSQN